MKKLLKIFSIIVLLFLAFGAFYGSYSLISDPTGALFNWNVDLLKDTPFKDFLVPGIILLVVNGLFPLVIIITAIGNKKYFPALMILQGLILLTWLSAELLFNPELYAPGLTPLFYVVGALLVIIALFEWKFYKPSVKS